ncbi:GNAT family N-acetyltransferase [Zobellella maritima]|uniref:GNAT family N-acetyltransferase n=1 Tax=Zobellella maritima TaxID=2059725 RepID=UPI000E3063DF|nr:GNAT family N-acetyltransferase [Zobellella maritima]
MYLIRDYHETDLSRLALIYRDAVVAQGGMGYSSGQVAAWSEFPCRYADEFRTMVERGYTRVVCRRQTPVAFATLYPDHHLALLYVLAEHSRRGLAGRLCADMQQEAQRRGAVRLTTDASLLSRPVFERCGFQVMERQEVTRDGQVFTRFAMAKLLRLP